MPVAAARRRSGRGAAPVLVEVRRGGRVESRHRGAIAVTSTSGEALASVGDPDETVFLRSTAKPFQLAPFVASGLFDGYGLGSEALAIMAASHSGEDRHVRLVQSILRSAGLTQSVLQCGTHPPFDAETAERLIRDGEEPSPIRHNCSGKHAGMVLFAKAAGWPIERYWQPDHPVQQAALRTVAALTDLAPGAIATATDGCGVVTFGVPLQRLALAFARLADPAAVGDAGLRVALERIAGAMIEHPILVGGERRRFDTALMRAGGGRLLAKGGAEAVQGIGLLRGARGPRTAAVGLALKIEDGLGGARAGGVATAEALRQLGALGQAALDQLAPYAAPEIIDPRGARSGEIRAVFALR